MEDLSFVNRPNSQDRCLHVDNVLSDITNLLLLRKSIKHKQSVCAVEMLL